MPHKQSISCQPEHDLLVLILLPYFLLYLIGFELANPEQLCLYRRALLFCHLIAVVDLLRERSSVERPGNRALRFRGHLNFIDELFVGYLSYFNVDVLLGQLRQ